MSEYPDYVVTEAVRQLNIGKTAPFWGEVDRNHKSVKTVCRLLTDGCEPLKPPTNPDLLLAREILSVSFTSAPHIRDRYIAGVYDSDQDLIEILKFIKENNITKGK